MHGTAFPKDEVLNSIVHKYFIKCFLLGVRSIGNTTRVSSLISGDNAKVQGGIEKVRKIISEMIVIQVTRLRNSP